MPILNFCDQFEASPISAESADIETSDGIANDEDIEDEDASEASTDYTASLLSWCIGTAFGRFDIRIATGERALPPGPDPFDPVPSRSPGMLPDGDPPFHPKPDEPEPKRL